MTGKGRYPAYRVPSGSSELRFPLERGEVALALLTGGHTPRGSQRSNKAKGQLQQKTRALVAGRSPSTKPAGAGNALR